MEQDLLRQLLALMDEGSLTEIEYENEDARVRLARQINSVVTAAPAVAAAVPVPPGAAAASDTVPTEPSVVEGEVFTAPMVGTFYAAPNPDSDAFLSIGKTLNEESVVCILEAMKVMNEIKAECRGEVLSILVQDGDPVEFGQPLFTYRPQG
ncbi:MAG: acetyl-CoA carboxylase biotin carboxyl carrier protein [Planctomycetes bacterium]|nr:acetyl-CoA carboxylase biotin carboxyl carrier protein [Planctomycetota bacterium]